MTLNRTRSVDSVSAMNHDVEIRVLHHLEMFFRRFWFQCLHNCLFHVQIVDSSCLLGDSSFHALKAVEQEGIDDADELLDVAFWWRFSSLISISYRFSTVAELPGMGSL